MRIVVSEPDCASEIADRFYMVHGKCCAGCDWWAQVNSLVGECTRTAPVSGVERVSMLGVSAASLPLKAGHIATPRDHCCGEFSDEFDWHTLPASYLRRIGWPPAVKGSA